MEIINLNQKFATFAEHWNPKIVASLNGQYVKLAKLKGEFIWHSHEQEDELFMVIKGKLKMAFRDKTVDINEGEIIVVPKGVEHKPIAPEEVHVLLFEPASTLNTGNIQNERTIEKLENI